MMRYLILLAGLAGLALAACDVATTAHGRAVHRPVYTLAAIREGLARHAGTWLGRPVLVRGVVSDCGPLNAMPIYCLAQGPVGPGVAGVDPLPLVRARQDGLWAFLRHLPLVGSLVPTPQAMRWDVAEVYRVQLQAQTRVSCLASVCYEAVLLDAATP